MIKLRTLQFWSGTLANGETRSLFTGNEIELDDATGQALLAEYGDRFETLKTESDALPESVAEQADPEQSAASGDPTDTGETGGDATDKRKGKRGK
ncbi:MAG: hypothetical protein WCF84_26725 [Anaerolineae bacterium]